jgi:hypothetical protein
MEEELDEAACKVLIRKPDRKRSFRGPIYRWDGFIEMVFKEMWCGVDLFGLGLFPVVVC